VIARDEKEVLLLECVSCAFAMTNDIDDSADQYFLILYVCSSIADTEFIEDTVHVFALVYSYEPHECLIELEKVNNLKNRYVADMAMWWRYV
jgi:hypothetical protein